jgi:hypothetical protein
VSDAIAERASAIRQHLRDHADQPLVRKYSFVAARYEQMRLAMHDGRTTPADDVRFREVCEMLKVLTKKLGLGERITAWKGEWLPGDPQRITSDSWPECARLWYA